MSARRNPVDELVELTEELIPGAYTREMQESMTEQYPDIQTIWVQLQAILGNIEDVVIPRGPHKAYQGAALREATRHIRGASKLLEEAMAAGYGGGDVGNE